MRLLLWDWPKWQNVNFIVEWGSILVYNKMWVEISWWNMKFTTKNGKKWNMTNFVGQTEIKKYD